MIDLKLQDIITVLEDEEDHRLTFNEIGIRLHQKLGENLFDIFHALKGIIAKMLKGKQLKKVAKVLYQIKSYPP